jgi:hypothetical protein
MGLVTREGLLVAIALTLLPLLFLWALVPFFRWCSVGAGEAAASVAF